MVLRLGRMYNHSTPQQAVIPLLIGLPCMQIVSMGTI